MLISNLLNDITPEKAYFLGAVLVANENYPNKDLKKFWLAPVRHNPGQVTEHEIRQHYTFVKIMSDKIGAKILTADNLGHSMGFSSGKKGFATIFEDDISSNVDFLLKDIISLFRTDRNLKRSFLVGVFDGRSSLDRNKQTGKIRNIAIDCESKKIHDVITNFLLEFGIEALNQNESRDRLSGGRPRKNQLRISHKGIANFISNIGFISPFRFKVFRSAFSEIPFVKNVDELLPGLKNLSNVRPEDTEQEALLDDNLLENINDVELMPTIHQYSGKPKAKGVPTISKERRIYNRNPQVAINALALARYNCEIDGTHKTFIRKKNDKPYTEPHHLVPMAFSDRFTVSLDVEENIISLCSHCHNLLHYGKDAKELLKLLFEKRKNMLEMVGISIDIEDLYEMYKLD